MRSTPTAIFRAFSLFSPIQPESRSRLLRMKFYSAPNSVNACSIRSTRCNNVIPTVVEESHREALRFIAGSIDHGREDWKHDAYRGTGFSGAVGEGEIGIPILEAATIALACSQPYQARLKTKKPSTTHHQPADEPASPTINPTIPINAPPSRPITLAIWRLRISPNGNQSKPRTICPPSSGKTGRRLKPRRRALMKFK